MAAVAVQGQQGFGHHQQPQQQQHSRHTPSQQNQPQSQQVASSADASPNNPATAVWQNANPPLPRGRAPRDPLAHTARLQCQTLADMEAKLRDYLEHPPAPPEHCTCELTLWAGASFLVKLDYVPPNLRPSSSQNDVGMLQAVADFNVGRQQGPFDGRETTMSVLDALQQLNDPKETMKRQRAISKVCVTAVQKTDGYRYSFHNSWKSGEDNAYRFSYYCNDSLLNKDRVANGKSGSHGKRATKPVYDCKGVLSIKFSATKQSVEIVYRHIPCHETYEERAPPPRKNSKRRAEWEEKNPERLKIPRESEQPSPGLNQGQRSSLSQSRYQQNTQIPPQISTQMPPQIATVNQPQISSQKSKQAVDVPKETKKKKKKKEGAEPHKTTEAELREESMFSLLELMRPAEELQKPEERAPTPVTKSPAVPQNTNAAPTSAGAQKAPARRPKNVVACAICSQRRTKCDGVKPKCKSCVEKGFYCFYAPEQNTSAAPVSAVAAPVPQSAAPVSHSSVPNSRSAAAPPIASLPGFDSVQQPQIIPDFALVGQNETLQKELTQIRNDHAQQQKDLQAKLEQMQKQIESLQSENARLNTPQQTALTQAGLSRALTQPTPSASSLSQQAMSGSPMNPSSLSASGMSQSMAQASLNQSAMNQPMAQSNLSNPLGVASQDHQRRTPAQVHPHHTSHQSAYPAPNFAQANPHSHQQHLYGHHGPSQSQTAHPLSQTSHSLGQNANTMAQASHNLGQNAHARQPQNIYGNPERANTWAQPGMYGSYANQYTGFR